MQYCRVTASCIQDLPYECINHTMTASNDFNFQIISRWRGVVEEYSSESDPKLENFKYIVHQCT